MAESPIELVRLPSVDVPAVMGLLNEPRNARHMPLVGEPFTRETTAAWMADKDDQWRAHGYGPWAILVEGEFAGWGGFQAEEDGPDFGLVLLPRFWGHGARIAELMLHLGFEELGFDAVMIALPYSRSAGRVVARWGFHADGQVVYAGAAFRRYRLTREDWSSRSSHA